MPRKQPIWRAPGSFQAMMPATSGNTVNGAGESTPRQPTPIFWHRPEKEIHGPLQEAIVKRFNDVPVLNRVYFDRDARGPRQLPEVAAQKVERSAEAWTNEIKAFALAHDAELVGIARYDPLWTYEGYAQPTEPWIIVLGIAMDHRRLSEVVERPDNYESAIEVAVQYNRGAKASRTLAAYLRNLGYRADPHTGPWAGAVSLLPAALACGFGELGKHGSIINRTLGSSFRLAGVLTDMPLIPDALDAFGADDFCARCRVCADACPPAAISDIKQLVRGVEKWYVDFDKCIPYFNETYGCGVCIAVCPWSTPGRAPNLAGRWTRRAQGPRDADGRLLARSHDDKGND